MLASSGEITAPCPVPLSLTVTTPSSRTPALSHLRIRRMMRGSPIRCSAKRMSQSWLTVSKNDRMSASNMKFTFVLVIPTTSASIVDPCVQALEIALEVCFVGLARQPVHAGNRVLLKLAERLSKQFRADVMEERGEPLLLPSLCDFPYALQR